MEVIGLHTSNLPLFVDGFFVDNKYFCMFSVSGRDRRVGTVDADNSA